LNDDLKILFLSRASLFSVRGGDTVQVTKTAEALQQSGVSVDIRLCNEKRIDYSCYDLIHFFNIRHPADMLFHIEQSKLPYVISTIYVDYARPANRKSSGLKDGILNLFGSDAQEYIKTMGKSIFNGEKIVSGNYVWRGHKRSVRWILSNAAWLLPNSENEYRRLLNAYRVEKKYSVIPNGADTSLFNYSNEELRIKDHSMVLCVARIELIKNQLNLIKALNGTIFQLYIIGDPAPNHMNYYNECKRISESNIHFVSAIRQDELVKYYRKAKVHVLPSWFETTGLSSLEALYCGCNIVVTSYGDTTEYYDPASCVFCDPGSPGSIREAVEKAASGETRRDYVDAVSARYNWQQAAEKTLVAYQQAIDNKQ
jgi:glycosyltransferase involved in cell wall biosynthesis